MAEGLVAGTIPAITTIPYILCPQYQSSNFSNATTEIALQLVEYLFPGEIK